MVTFVNIDFCIIWWPEAHNDTTCLSELCITVLESGAVPPKNVSKNKTDVLVWEVQDQQE